MTTTLGGTGYDRELALAPVAQLLRRTRSALVIVDGQNRFLFDDAGRPAATASVLPHMQELLGVARELGFGRCFVKVGDASLGATGDEASWVRRLGDINPMVRSRTSITPSEWGYEIAADIKPEYGEAVFTKHRFSAFYETGLELFLRANGVETIVLAGVASYGCLLPSVTDAACRGFFPVVAAEAIAGADPVLHQAATTLMGPEVLLGTSEVVAAWREVAAT